MVDTVRHLESEVKIPVEDLIATRRRLVELGANLAGARSLEHNILYDHPDGRLQRSDQALRLRRVGDRTLLTFKGPACWSHGIRDREETEVEVGDGDAMQAILRQAGFEPRFRYEKWREHWHLEGYSVALDETPMGSFVEIEGPRDGLRAAARELRLDLDQVATGSYPTLWAAHRRRHPELGLPVDMVFDP